MKTEAPRQLVFDIAPSPAYGPEDFLVAPSNQLAFDYIHRWPRWPSAAGLLIGPEGVGKSHLLEIWRRRADALMLDVSELSESAVPDIMSVNGAVALDHVPDSRIEQAALFHLLNAARENRGYILITSRTPPNLWGLTLPDLISRLSAAPAIHIQPAEDELLRGVLVKLFADRQCAVDENLLAYLMTRMPRSLGAARKLVAALDERALEMGTGATRAMAGKVLAELFNIESTTDDADAGHS
jgi:chromosomal replication initiation ATPase DnaA